MNQAVLIGRLTNSPEARTTNSGVSVTTFTVAVNSARNREKSGFFNVVTWRGLADICANHLVKGQQVAVTGEIQTRTYDAKDGTKRYVTEIIANEVEFLSKPKIESHQAQEVTYDGFSESEDDNLPF